MSESMLWETLKVVICRDIISYESAAKKVRKKQLSEIEDTLSALETAYQASKSPDDHAEILKLRYEYSSLLDGQINNLPLKLRLQPLATAE